jgi:microcystin-dependent protein
MKFKTLLLGLLILTSFSAFSQEESYIGTVKLFAGNFAPRGWAFCSGQLIPIAQNQALFAVLGTTYGGDGRTTFALPDLRGRVPVHVDNNKITLGEVGGSETTVINPSVSQLKTSGVSLDTKTTGRDGAPSVLQSAQLLPVSQPQVVDNRPPYLGLNYIICIYGIFPSRD